ncbi:hypothetical protein BRADI_3g35805v3 [Brachypodium distachyon]|uniref:Uncharacterized protein n=1 Tax=Brachypodium distachyon TaxID=15368 RepID=A0A0Q3ICY9_BRADI|nr:hypothetical protein BRADI_3g35805v3 [Brachypodium distachyon]
MQSGKGRLRWAVVAASLMALLLLLVTAVQGADDSDGERLILNDAMRADAVPGRDRSLSRPAAVANTFSRGCEKIEHCRARLGTGNP